MIKGNDDTRFGRRLESLFWWILRLFPLVFYILYLCCLFFSKPLMSFIVENSYSLPVSVLDYLVEMSSFEVPLSILGLSPDSIVFSTLYRIFFTGDGILPFVNSYGFLLYFSYLVFIEIARFLISFFCFIIRLANNLFDRMSR